MASSINAITTGSGGVITTADNSGDLNIQSGGSTKIAVTSAGANIVGTLTVNGVAPASGKVLQVVHVNYDVDASTSSSSYVDTGLSASITPTSATSKILVIISQQAAMYGSSYLAYPQFVIARDGATIASTVKNAVGRANSVTNFQFSCIIPFNYLDSPATTSSVTYKTQMKNDPSYGGTIYAQDGGFSNITLLEIAA
jgi:hypothetical protein